MRERRVEGKRAAASSMQIITGRGVAGTAPARCDGAKETSGKRGLKGVRLITGSTKVLHDLLSNYHRALLDVMYMKVRSVQYDTSVLISRRIFLIVLLC
jgi:hypothetical protein